MQLLPTPETHNKLLNKLTAFQTSLLTNIYTELLINIKWSQSSSLQTTKGVSNCLCQCTHNPGQGLHPMVCTAWHILPNFKAVH